MKVKIVNTSTNELPKYQTSGSAGCDICAYLSEPIELKPLERKLIPTGLYIEFEEGYEAQVRARSGLSIKHGITMVNGIGTIDSDYRGELKIPMVNLSNETYTINNGDRIAQIVFNKVEVAQFVEVQELNDTERSTGGFGSTGIKVR